MELRRLRDEETLAARDSMLLSDTGDLGVCELAAASSFEDCDAGGYGDEDG